ncbi:hypothetical protein PTR52_24400 [Serratia nevei]|uniref:hypothetical protein n=1 Tax=Serratia TaxID=613 RepID=UPI0007454CA1|nr:hypothetical protein [Serratia marcescens]CUZ60014.1 Uncharacterised protein [Serratia marcescens]CVB52167.1 Uncharacterised protein [Serratia marcescens]CVB93567.1 Uncharacterised protein [Serratia marcescens]CVF19491.1 Uncharacterised protein [Serratia marcescens]
MDNKLSELSKPVAYTDADELRFHHATSDMWPVPLGFGKDVPLYSQEYVSALLAGLEAKDNRIAELESIREDASQVFTEIGNELGCNPDNESIMMAIDELKKRLATPVRLPKRWDVSGQVNPPRIVEVQFEQQNRTHDQCAKAIRDAGFTVVVEGVE